MMEQNQVRVSEKRKYALREERQQMADDRDKDRDYVFHERINILKRRGYRGFNVARESSSPAGEIELTAMSQDGKVLTATGETREEALKKIIDRIDPVLK